MLRMNQPILAIMAALAFGATLGSSPAMAAGSRTSEMNSGTSFYQQQRAACDSGQTAESRRDCLREAAAAAEEQKRHRLSRNLTENDFERNAVARCNALPPADRDACQRRVKGEGRISGSVASGGIYRELTVPETSSGESMPSNTNTNSGGGNTGTMMQNGGTGGTGGMGSGGMNRGPNDNMK